MIVLAAVGVISYVTWTVPFHRSNMSFACSRLTFIQHSLSSLGSPDDPPGDLSPEEIKREAQKWVRKCTIGATLAFSLWAVWIILFHVFQNQFPSSWFVRSEDDADLTGW